MMKYFETQSTDPYFNLSFEEYIHKIHTHGDILILWQNNNTIVYGLNQNPLEEINLDKAEEYKVKVIRRNTGGGTVYHDMGNLNFSYITDWNDGKNADYELFLKPVIDAFSELGLTIEQKGRNDLILDGKKISGSAQRLIKNRILHHGTLLIDSDLDFLGRVLHVSQDKIKSKGIKSVRSRVTNIQDHVHEKVHISHIKNLLLQHWFKNEKVGKTTLNNSELACIKKMAKEKYQSWEWNYGRSPKFGFKNKKRFPGGEVQVNLDVKNGLIAKCIINGDFLGLQPVDAFEDRLIGEKYDAAVIGQILQTFPVHLLFGDITASEIVSCFFANDTFLGD